VNTLQQKYAAEIDAVLEKYPPEQKRSAMMALVYLAQREQGFVTKQSMKDIAEILNISTTEVASVVSFYSLYHTVPGGKYRIQVCTDLPCALHGADEFLAKLCENLGIRVGETTADGLVTVEQVMCLAGCNKAPIFQTQTSEGLNYHENQTVESATRLIESWRSSKT
jgi:NADH-quinone oxidoreductase subunit E